MTINNELNLTNDFYNHIDSIKKDCAKRMKSKSHDQQLEKFVDTLWLDGHNKEVIIHSMMHCYNVTKGYAETFVNCFLNCSGR